MKTSAEYREQLLSLLPPGRLNVGKTSNLFKFFWGLGEELSRVDGRMDDLFDESIVSKIRELLNEYEDDYGIYNRELTDAERVAALRVKLLQVGQQNKAYFVEIAEAMEHDIEIVEFRPAWVEIVTVTEPVGSELKIYSWFVWVNINEPMKWYIRDLIDDFFRIKPAHTNIGFEFKGAAFSRAYNRASSFNAIQHYDGSFLPGGFGLAFGNDFQNSWYYDGYNYIGDFGKAFSFDFNAQNGGQFEFFAFSGDFNTPL